MAIIGAGIAGLSTGCYLQMNGYDTQIFEMGKLPGGLCTSWKKKDYIFDGCIHWLVGSDPEDPFYKFWQELGVIKDREFLNLEYYAKYEDKDGKVFTVYTNIDKLKNEMLAVAPEDEEIIEEFIDDLKKYAGRKMPIDKAPQLYNFLDGIKAMAKMLPILKLIRKYDMPISEYSAKFKNPFLRQIFPSIFSIYDFPTSSILAMISWMYNKSGYPIGGSLELAKSIEKRYLSLRGKINYNSKVVKIITENNIATGIKLENGNTHAADIIISAADGHYTIFEMLEGKYVNQEISDMYNNMELFPSIIQISLGIVDSLKDYPCHLIFPLDSPIVIDDKNNLGILGIKIFNYDPTLAPKGKVTVTTFFKADYEYWVRLREENKEKYNAEKERIAKEVISAIDKKIPGISSKVDVYDVATPATYIRYTNIWKGSYEGWIPKAKALMARIKYTLPGLDNFYMVGQWVQPGGGIPSGAMTGRNVTQIICKKDNKKFMTTIT